METLSHILASFDIFQVIINVFPQIFSPVFHAFKGIFIMLSDVAGREFVTHPGLIAGTVIFTLLYATWSGVSRLTRKAVPASTNTGKRS
jgi:hypothetical protein